jgi:hypothetical protein
MQGDFDEMQGVTGGNELKAVISQELGLGLPYSRSREAIVAEQGGVRGNPTICIAMILLALEAERIKSDGWLPPVDPRRCPQLVRRKHRMKVRCIGVPRRAASRCSAGSLT